MRPETEAELAGIIRAATGPLAVRGGGTRHLPGEGGGAVLQTGGISGITLYEPEALTVIVRAGTPLVDLQQALAAEHQQLAFEPPARPGATVGGMVAVNAAGPRRVQAGACRDALIGLRMVDGSGTVIRNGGRVMKNVTGYDLVKLAAGSRGRLGVLTELAFKTAPIPPASATLSLPGLDAIAAIPALTEALTGPFDVSGAGWHPDHGAVIRIEGLDGSVAIRRAALRERLSRFGEVSEGDNAVWRLLCENTHESGADLWRIACRPSEAAGILARLPGRVTLDWGGALIHAEMPPGELPGLPAFSGHATRIRGAQPAVLPPPDPVVARIDAQIAARFDPRGLFQG